MATYKIVSKHGKTVDTLAVSPRQLREDCRLSFFDYFGDCELRGPGFFSYWGPISDPDVEITVQVDKSARGPGNYSVQILAKSMPKFRWAHLLVRRKLGFETDANLVGLAWEILGEYNSLKERLMWLFKGVIPSIS